MFAYRRIVNEVQSSERELLKWIAIGNLNAFALFINLGKPWYWYDYVFGTLCTAFLAFAFFFSFYYIREINEERRQR